MDSTPRRLVAVDAPHDECTAGRRRDRRGVRRSVPLFAPLLVLTVLAVLALVPTTTAAIAPAAYPWCTRNPEVPDYAYDVEDFVRSHNGSPPPGVVGGKPYRNDPIQLPLWYAPFREYDVHAQVTGQGRDDERIVLGYQHQASWFTTDHFATFLTMHPWGCFPLLT